MKYMLLGYVLDRLCNALKVGYFSLQTLSRNRKMYSVNKLLHCKRENLEMKYLLREVSPEKKSFFTFLFRHYSNVVVLSGETS